MNLTALITSFQPLPTCETYFDLTRCKRSLLPTIEGNCCAAVVFQLSAHAQAHSKPNIASLEICVKTSTSSCGFQNNDNERNDADGSNSEYEEQLRAKICNLISCLTGIEERLADAAESSSAVTGVDDEARGNNNNQTNDLESFLVKSEAVFRELISAMIQKEEDYSSSTPLLSRKQKRESESENPNASASTAASEHEKKKHRPHNLLLPVQYYYGLISQLDSILSLYSEDKVKIVHMSDDLKSVTFSCVDKAGSVHELTVSELCSSFSGGNNSSGDIGDSLEWNAPIYISDLPCEFAPPWKLNPLLYESEVVDNSLTDNNLPQTIITNDNDNSMQNNTKKSYGLVSVYHHFRTTLSKYQPFWEEVSDLDTNAWVIEPSLPARKSIASRRIALLSNGRLSMSFVISDVENPRRVPSNIRFMGGAEGTEVAKLRDAVNKYVAVGTLNNGEESSVQGWSELRSIRENLTISLGFPLPSPKTTQKSDYVIECGICYTHRLLLDDDENKNVNENEVKEANQNKPQLPDIMCGNIKCARGYHESCLFEWLHSSPSARMSFGRLFGKCPYCCETLSVRVKGGPSLLS